MKRASSPGSNDKQTESMQSPARKKPRLDNDDKALNLSGSELSMALHRFIQADLSSSPAQAHINLRSRLQSPRANPNLPSHHSLLHAKRNQPPNLKHRHHCLQAPLASPSPICRHRPTATRVNLRELIRSTQLLLARLQQGAAASRMTTSFLLVLSKEMKRRMKRTLPIVKKKRKQLSNCEPNDPHADSMPQSWF